MTEKTVPNEHERAATLVYVLFSFVVGFGMTVSIPVAALYRMQDAGLVPAELLWVGIAHEATRFIFEIPTGVIADSWGRKNSIILGLFLSAAGLGMEGLLPRFSVILLAQLFWGIGLTFISGAELAWFTDEVGETRARSLYGRATSARFLGAASGIVLGSFVGARSKPAAYFLAAVLFALLGVACTFALHERRVSPPATLGYSARLNALVRLVLQSISKSDNIKRVFMVAAATGVALEGFDRLWEARLIVAPRFTEIPYAPPLILGATISVALIVTAVCGMVPESGLGQTPPPYAKLALFGVLPLAVGMSAFVFAGSAFGAIAGFITLWGARGILEPVQAAWLNDGIANDSRATLNSALTQVNALGQLFGGVSIAVALRVLSVRTAISLGIPVLIATCIWLYFLHRSQRMVRT